MRTVATLLVLSAADIRAALPLAASVAAQKSAFASLATGGHALGGSVYHPGPAPDQLVFALTGAVPGRTGVVVKFGMQVPGNTARGLPTVQGLVTILDPDDGTPLAVLDGATITTMRTAHGLAAAADVLAVPDARVVGVLGSGVQAREVALALASLRALADVRVWSPTRAHAQAMADDLVAAGLPARAVGEAQDAVRGADVVATCTLSRTPIVHAAWIAPGATVLTLGSYAPDRRELALDVTARADLLVLDDAAKALTHGGCVVEADEAGVLDPARTTTLGDVLVGTHPGRTDDAQVLVFHSMGVGVQDAEAAWAAWTAAVEQGLGRRVPL
ncbi:ornithine cyclodeaminase family protein [Cellulomonas sp. P22]|uniref:ornithine cyclodeaminase family protein n=1 Tax=Cellulomonas sp. P22 TaxID=3373189 RepID=UPI0037B6FD57